MKKTASLNMETNSNKLLRLTKQLNDEENRHAKTTLLQDRKMVHGIQVLKLYLHENEVILKYTKYIILPNYHINCYKVYFHC